MCDQKYILENQESFELEDIFECGQCFRWYKQEDKSYTGVVENSVINVKKDGNRITFSGYSKDNNFEEIIREYFDLNTNYTELKNKLSNIDNNLKIATRFGSGLRILNQDLWECIISFIISANNNIPRIRNIIEKMSKRYGKEICWKGKKYYTFPTVEDLSKVSVKDLREIRFRF